MRDQVSFPSRSDITLINATRCEGEIAIADTSLPRSKGSSPRHQGSPHALSLSFERPLAVVALKLRRERRRGMDAPWLIFPVLSPTCCFALVARVICATLPEARCAQRSTSGRTVRYRRTPTLTNAETASTALRSTKSNKIQDSPLPFVCPSASTIDWQ